MRSQKIRPSITLGRIIIKFMAFLNQLNCIKRFREQSHDVRYHGDNVHHQN